MPSNFFAAATRFSARSSAPLSGAAAGAGTGASSPAGAVFCFFGGGCPPLATCDVGSAEIGLCESVPREWTLNGTTGRVPDPASNKPVDEAEVEEIGVAE